ncbi:MAG: toxin-antitoxin system TumE family protein [bacterium]
MTFEKYLHIVDNLLARHWAITENQVSATISTPKFGKINGKVILLDGSYIDFSEEILIVDKQVTKLRYRYEYVKDKNEVFRYDNFAKHPGIRPPFHHKHISKRRAIQVKEAPKLIDVIEEALRYMF